MPQEELVLEPRTLRLLGILGETLGDSFFLVGGTALAIHYGHRKSIDLDFFTRDKFDIEEVLSWTRHVAEREGMPLVIAGRSTNTLNLVLDGVKVDLIRYNYRLLDVPLKRERYRLLDVPDLAAMKLSAIANRGSKKNFFDIGRLLDEYTLTELLEFYQKKFPDHDSFFVVRSLGFFDDAEQEPDPLLLSETTWEEVKQLIGERLREEL